MSIHTDIHVLGDVSYKKWNLYDMDWGEMETLNKNEVVGGKLGGPIAMLSGGNAVYYSKIMFMYQFLILFIN